MAGQITHEWNGSILTITSDSGTSSADLKGPEGDQGIRGPQGPAGSGSGGGSSGGYYTPIASQTDEQTLTLGWTPSESDMPEVANVDITLPSGLDVDYSSDYTGQFLGLIISSEDTTKCEVIPRSIQGSKLKLGDDGFELTPITGPLWFAGQVKDSLTLMDVEVVDKGALNEINGGDASSGSAEDTSITTSIKWACLGDSITDLRTNRPNNYPYWIDYRNPSMTVQNLGIGGALMCFDRDNRLSDGSPVNSIYTQAQSIDDDVDIITVFGGVNDYNWSVPLGTFPNDLTNFMDGFDTTTKVDTSEGHNGLPDGTFYQGCYRLARYLRTRFPNKPIIWFTPMTFGVGNAEGKDVENHNDNNIYEFMDAVKKVAAYFSIPCYDLGRLCSITPRIQEMQDLYYFDNLHPNADGSLIISRIIEREMKKVLAEWGVNL